MNKLYIVLGITLLLFSFASARADISASPVSMTACCDSAAYEVTITNELPSAQAFRLSARTNRDVQVILQPDVVLIPGGGEEKLIMLARSCVPGEYAISLKAEYQGACEDVCGDFCTYSYESEALLIVPDSCEAPSVPAVLVPDSEVPEDSEDPEDTGDTDDSVEETPAGAVVAGDDYFAIGLLFVLLAVFIIMLFMISKASKVSSKANDKSECITKKSGDKK
jgi:hypothetical protein